MIGSGISGGWAAKVLCEKGLKVLLLESEENVKYPWSCVNPSLTYMAMTARACAYAVTDMKKRNI